MKNINEQKFLRRVEELVGFSLSPEQSGVALGVLSDVVAKAKFDIATHERAEEDEIRENYRRLIKTSNRVVKG